MHGERLGPNDPQAVTVITTNPDLFYSSNHPSPRHGPQVLEAALQAICKKALNRDIVIERYGKPYTFNYDFTEEFLRTKAAKRAIKISKFYMIGDNPLSDIAGANKKGWVSILVRSGVFDANDATMSLHGNHREHPATHVVDTFKDAIELIYRLENLTLE